MKIKFVTVALFLAMLVTPVFASNGENVTVPTVPQTTVLTRNTDVKHALIEIISDISGKSKHKIKDEALLRYDLDMSSIEIVELSIACENVFSITISDEQVEEWLTVLDVYDTVIICLDNKN